MPKLPIPIIRKIISEIDFSSFFLHMAFFSRLMTYKTQQKVEWNYFLDRARKNFKCEYRNFQSIEHKNLGVNQYNAHYHGTYVFIITYTMDRVTVCDYYYYPPAQDMYKRTWYNLDSSSIYSPNMATEASCKMLSFLKYIQVSIETPDVLKLCQS